MGAGKTTVGNILANLADLPYIDIDEVITSEQGMSVSDIFAKYGEKEFRRLEHEKLKELATTKAVIATGGGIVLNPENREVLKNTYPVIYLETDPEVFMNRLKGDTTRPLVQQKQPKKFVQFSNQELLIIKIPQILLLIRIIVINKKLLKLF